MKIIIFFLKKMNSFILPIIKSHVIFNENTNNLKILNNPKY